jgi:hypothetical protein
MRILKVMLIVLFIFSAFVCYNNQGRAKSGYAGTSVKRTVGKHSVAIADNKEGEKTVPCINLIVEIVKTSPRYRELTKGLEEEIKKNGGISYGISLEGSPHPAKDKACCYSKTYDFTVNEIYSSRQLSAARFSFNPENQLLYEYDAVLEEKVRIDFDEDLLLTYDVICK